MKQLFRNPRRLGLVLALLGLGLSAFAVTRDPPSPAPRYIGIEHADAQRVLARQPDEAPAPTF